MGESRNIDKPSETSKGFDFDKFCDGLKFGDAKEKNDFKEQFQNQIEDIIKNIGEDKKNELVKLINDELGEKNGGITNKKLIKITNLIVENKDKNEVGEEKESSIKEDQKVKAEAGEATAEAGEATAEAGEATAEAGEATAEAGEATAEAGEATAEAGEAEEDKEKAEANREALLNEGNKISQKIGLTNLEGYEELKDRAKSELGTTDEKEINSYILTYGQNALFKNNPSLENKYGTELRDFKKKVVDAGIFSGKELAVKGKKIDAALSKSPSIIKTEVEKTKELFTSNGNTDLDIVVKNNGDVEIKSKGDSKDSETQVITIDEKGVKKTISKYGYEIEIPSKIDVDMERKREIKGLSENLSDMGKKIENNYNVLENIPDGDSFKENDLKTLQNTEGIPENLVNSIDEYIDYKNENENNIFEGDEPPNDKERYLEKKVSKEINNIKEETQKMKEEFEQKQKTLIEIAEKDTNNSKKNEFLQKEADNKGVDTLEFLNNIGFTTIKQNDLQKIITQINQNPIAYGLSKKIDFKEGFYSSPTNKNIGKQEFLKVFTPIYEKIGINIDITRLSEGIQNQSLQDKSLLTQRLEESGITKGGAIQYNTVLELLNKNTPKIETALK